MITLSRALMPPLQTAGKPADALAKDVTTKAVVKVRPFAAVVVWIPVVLRN